MWKSASPPAKLLRSVHVVGEHGSPFGLMGVTDGHARAKWQTLRQRRLMALHSQNFCSLCPYITNDTWHTKASSADPIQVGTYNTFLRTHASGMLLRCGRCWHQMCTYTVKNMTAKSKSQFSKWWNIYTISQGKAWDISSFKGHHISRFSSATMKPISFEIRIGKNLLHRAESKRLVLMWSRSRSSQHRFWSPSERNSHSLPRQIHDCLWTVLPQTRSSPVEMSSHLDPVMYVFDVP